MKFAKWDFSNSDKEYYIKSLLHNDKGIMLFLVRADSADIK